MIHLPVPSKTEVKQLMLLANVSLSDKKAKSWLEYALVALQVSNKAVKKGPIWAHNERLDDVAKAASLLTKRLQRLQSNPYSWLAFWRALEPGMADAFARGFAPKDESGQLLDPPARATPLDDQQLLSMLSYLSYIERAANTAMDPRTGRPRKVLKQRVVDLALAFFVRHSSVEPSGTSTGPFGKFAHAFYAVAIKRDSDDDVGLDRQIREARQGAEHPDH